MCANCLCNLHECATVKGGAKASGLNRWSRTLGNPHKSVGYPSSKKRRNTKVACTFGLEGPKPYSATCSSFQHHNIPTHVCCWTWQIVLHVWLVLVHYPCRDDAAHFRWVSRFQILRDQFGLIWSKLNPWVGPCLGPQLASWFFKSWAFLFSFFFGLKPIDFPSKMRAINWTHHL